MDIKSSTIEKAIEIAKEFLSKLISPAVEEVGLLFGDNVKYIRYKNQIKILNKAREYVEKNNVSLKEIPIKILVPLLENSSLEDNEDLQDIWAKMLVNMANSDANFQNHVYPFILSQISFEEFNGLNKLLEQELDYYRKLNLFRKFEKTDSFGFKGETRKAREEVTKIETDGFLLNLSSAECFNLIRLGLIHSSQARVVVEPVNFSNEQLYSASGNSGMSSEIEARLDTDNMGYRLTELGDEFLDVCKIKKNI